MRRNWLTAFTTAALLTSAIPVLAQPKPAPSSAASAAPSAQPKDAKKSDAKPTASAAAGGLPAGHPPTGEGMPAGHPKVGADPGDEASPHGRGGGREFFTPPPDGAVDDPSLPAGTIVVNIKDAQDRPLPQAPIVLGVLHSTVAKGDTHERKTATTDDSGAVRFDGLSFGSGHTYEVTTTRGPARYAHPPVGLGDKVGKRIVVHAYESSPRIDSLAVAMQGAVFVSLRESAIQVEQLISVYNLGPISWTADAKFQLPAGFKAFNKPETSGDARIEEVPGTGAALRGTFPPGRTDIDFRYQIPLDNSEQQTFSLQLPPRVAMARVIAEASRNMGLSVSGFPEAQRTEGRDGKRLLITEHQATRAEGGVPQLEIRLSGLPTPGPGRWIAVALGVVALIVGGMYFREHKDGALDDDARRDLIEAREALLGEIVALERAHRSGEIGAKTYARIRASLLDALSRIMNMREDAKRARALRKGPRREKAEPAT